MRYTALPSVLIRSFRWLNGKLTDGAYQHGRYCICDQKIRCRDHA